MKKNIFRLFIFVLISVLILGLVGCNKSSENNGESVKLSFKSAASYDYLKTLNGQTITINGYMATSSPVDGSFFFLMNLPYQSCPFCVPNTSQLSNTIEVYPKDGDSFEYTSQAVKVVGTLEVAESEDKPFTDMYGYEFNYKISDAVYTIIQADELSEDMALWQEIANSDVINDIYKMYDYVNFLCAWNTYYVDSYTDTYGNTVAGYYLYPQDALNYVLQENAQYNYGYQDGYFDNIITSIKQVDETAFDDLVQNIEKAKNLAQKAFDELNNGNYTSEYRYVEQFGQSDYVYTLNLEEELNSEMDEIYNEFSNWLASWEM